MHVVAVNEDSDELIESQKVDPGNERDVLLRHESGNALRAAEIANEAEPGGAYQRNDPGHVEHAEERGNNCAAREPARTAPSGEKDQERPGRRRKPSDLEERQVHIRATRFYRVKFRLR